MLETIILVLLILMVTYIVIFVRAIVLRKLTAPKTVVYVSAVLGLLCAFIPACIAMSPRLSYDYEARTVLPLLYGVPIFLLVFAIASFVSWQRN